MDPHDAAVKTPVEGSHDAAVTSAQRRDLGLAFLFVFCLANVVFHGWLHPLVSRLCTRAGARVEATKAAAPADA